MSVSTILLSGSSLDEHHTNVTKVLKALGVHTLYCSPKKTVLFTNRLNFLDHHISHHKIEADGKKVKKILQWPTPQSAFDIRPFLGLVQYISNFLLAFAQHTSVLTLLTTKEAKKHFIWAAAHQATFDIIKKLVISCECLAVIDHNNIDSNKVFVCCDTSDTCTDAVLLYDKILETIWPVAFKSQQLKGTELNYSVYKKELFSIVQALKMWRDDLISVPILVYTDHKTLENFNEQKHLSHH